MIEFSIGTEQEIENSSEVKTMEAVMIKVVDRHNRIHDAMGPIKSDLH